MSAVAIKSFSGRQAAIERRRALSAGKAALPPAQERVRNGERSAALPGDSNITASTVDGQASDSSASSAVSLPPAASVGSSSQSGRLLSMMRRRQMAGGKNTLVANAGSSVASRSESSAPAGSPEDSAAPAALPPVMTGSGRAQAQARRALLSQRGRGGQPAAVPTRPPRQGSLQYPAKVIASETHGGQRVTGSRIGRGMTVTGDEPGAYLPVSGTQYIGASDGAPVRSGGPKVGLSRTAGGAIVSGTLMRGNVHVTGDEPGSSITITGESDQGADDDVTPRSAERAAVGAQFSRQMDPHGQSVFGTNIRRSAKSFGSRERVRAPALELSENGLPITGSAVGRGGRVTGDETGACRTVTGNQYLTPAGSQAECGGSGGGTAPMGQSAAARRDPASAGKVSVAQTWGSQRLTGTNVEHDPRVTGEAAGSCSTITGTSYQGPNTVHGWCEPAVAAASEARIPRRVATSAVTGDIPHHSDTVTGTGRGAARDITGSPYFRESTPGASPGEEGSVAGIDARFSVTSPQRTAQLRSRAAKETLSSPGKAGSGEPSITGSFAIANHRVTGNSEFHFRSRSVAAPDSEAAHSRLTGEGSTEGTRVTGWSWEAQSNVTGADGGNAVARNSSERAGKPQAFSGAQRFKTLAKHEDSKQLVTGLLGWSGKTAAKVTLSGGAQA